MKSIARLHRVSFVALLWLATIGGAAQAAEVQPLSAETASEYGLSREFFQKSLLVQDILIATSNRVPDVAIQEAAYQFDMIMSSIDAEVADRVRAKRVLCILLGHQELTSSVPRFATDKTGKELDFYNWRQRGFLTRTNGRPTVLFAEEDVLEYEGGMQLESILIHEFGHVIHNAGFDERLQKKLTDAFQRARAKGIWMDGRAAQRFRRIKSETPVGLLDAMIEWFPERRPSLLRKCLDRGDILVNGQRANADVRVTRQDKVLIVFGGEKECYAHKNRAEYWAEGVQCWYDTNRTMDHDHNHIHTREQLRAYDPALAALCKEVLGDSPWRFVSPRQRAGKEHLADFDPQQAPQVVDPPHIEKAAYDYYDEYWASYWQRLEDKHSLTRELKAEGAEALATASQSGNPVRGAILFSLQELGCVNCHGAERRQLLGPDVTRLGKDVSAQHLVESLLYPSQAIREAYQSVQLQTDDGQVIVGRIVEEDDRRLILREAAGDRKLVTVPLAQIERRAKVTTSAMPERLVDQLDSRQDFLDLVKYLDEVKATGDAAPGQASGDQDAPIEVRGMAWLDVFQCRACHKLPNDADGAPLGPVQPLGPDLRLSDGRISPAHMRAFILDPQQVKLGTTMPHMMHRIESADEASQEQAVKEIVHFLQSLSPKRFQRQALDNEAIPRGRELFHQVGCVACHPADPAESEEAAKLDLKPLGPVGAKYSLQGLVDFLKAPHAARPAGRMPSLQLTHWEATDIANYLLGRNATYRRLRSIEPAPHDPSFVERGRQRFESLGCAACHAATAVDQERRIGPPLSAAKLQGGCLAESPGASPRFSLSPAQRNSMVAAIRAMEQRVEPWEPEQQIQRRMLAMRCNACHQRGGLEWTSQQRDEHFTTQNENLGPQGRLPPSLTGVGAKLQPKWLRDVLVQGRSIRPYMNTRMPQFRPEHVEPLVDLFAAADTPLSAPPDSIEDEREARKGGHQLAGRRGLNCIACHTFQRKRGASMSAVDLTEMAERLRRGWFFQYMEHPQRMSRGTVMPTFWPGGKAIRPEVLAGEKDRQIEAIWRYLQEGRQARAPEGLIRKPLRLLATDEAVMLRRSYPDIGKRGIGVGYPRQVNLAFDAEQLRWGLLWNGEFADPAGVFRSQGHGMVRPLSRNVVRLPKGPDVDDAAQPWKPEDDRPATHQFRGYELDEQRRPTFLYRFDGIEVSDYAADLAGESPTEPVLRRTLTLTAHKPRRGVSVRLAGGAGATAAAPNRWRVGEQLEIQLVEIETPAAVRTAIVQRNDVPQILLLLDVPAGETRVVVEYYVRP